jgi:hypothetical protein
MSCIKRAALFCIVLLVVLLPATAQIVNTESARMQSDTTGWQGGAGLGMSLTQNTVKIFGMEAETHLQYKTSNDRGLWLILGNYNFLKVGSKANISNYFAHFRYNRKINDWLRWEVFTQYQNNDVMQIDSRFLAGTGPRFKLIKNKFFRLYAGSLFMFENEKEKTSPAALHNDWRNSSYISFTWTPKDNIELISTTYLQPLLKKPSDYRLLNQAIFKVKASPHFALSVKWNYLYDRFPAGIVPRNPYSFSTGIDYDF